MPKKNLIIVGPTAVGKTSLSIELGLALNGEVISADSRYIYRGMDIGTAKPTEEERRGVVHHLIDILDPNEIWTLAQFQKETYRLSNKISENGKLPIIVGGTGQYIRSITKGWCPPEVEPNPDLREALEKWAKSIGSLGLHEKLKQLDPNAAAKIDHRNLRRTIRALEVILLTGYHFSEQRRITNPTFDSVIIGLDLPHEILYPRIDQRIEEMFKKGFQDEVQKLLLNGYAQSLPAMSAIGYREVADYLLGKTSLTQCVDLIKKSTRVYVRRQANWFKKNDPDILWIDPRFISLQDLIAKLQPVL